MTLLKENYDIFTAARRSLGTSHSTRSESSVLDSVIVRHKVSYLDGVLIMQHLLGT